MLRIALFTIIFAFVTAGALLMFQNNRFVGTILGRNVFLGDCQSSWGLTVSYAKPETAAEIKKLFTGNYQIEESNSLQKSSGIDIQLRVVNSGNTSRTIKDWMSKEKGINSWNLTENEAGELVLTVSTVKTPTEDDANKMANKLAGITGEDVYRELVGRQTYETKILLGAYDDDTTRKLEEMRKMVAGLKIDDKIQVRKSVSACN